MATSLSSYWVKFFSGAGFPLDVATKHAVVFSNNRIKPDMLPDLDKPSLKEMGITLMGDMIAILRYAKKVSDEMTCEKFLVDTNDSLPAERALKITKPVIKQLVSKTASPVTKLVPNKSSAVVKSPLKALKTVSSSVTTNAAEKKKPNVVDHRAKLISQDPQTRKRKVVTKIVEVDSESDEEWSMKMQKRLKLPDDDDKIAYKVVLPRSSAKPIDAGLKKTFDQKRTVFDRLGDSSVTSTTSSTSDANTTFNITGLGDVLKRNSSVFNRLGDKDAKKESTTAGILKNGNGIKSNGPPQGILKSRVSNIKSTTVKLKSPSSNNRITIGTMHADHERNKKSVSTSVKQLVKTTKALKLNNFAQRKVEGKIPINSKLVSVRGNSLSAKARLGSTGQKQVTFNRVTTVAHIQKPGVFSRLGI